MARRFTGAERVALYLAADGRCAVCGIALQPGWHGDHVVPYARGGPTDVINGQALCPPCNLRKRDTVTELRNWQADALAAFLGTDDDFLCVAAPATGKTVFAAAAADRLRRRGVIERVIVVVPTAHLRSQWAQVAHDEYGLELDPRYENSGGALARDYHGTVVTYQAVASQPLIYRRLARVPTLVILDEIHHGGDDNAWGAALTTAFGDAARRLLLSGTPDRTDRTPVPFVRYDDEGRFVADYTYSYGDALSDKEGVVRQVAFAAWDNDARWLDAHAVECKLRLSLANEENRRIALRSTLMPSGEWIAGVLPAADRDLTRQRETVPDSGGLVVALDQASAKRIAEILEGICGPENVTRAYTDEPGASDNISRFRRESSRWLVTVAMVSEGVDIPRLAVGVYATNITTPLFFRQVTGRLLRARTSDDETCATLFIPSVQPILGFAEEIERVSRQALREAEEAAAREVKEASQPLDVTLMTPLASTSAAHHSTILSGSSFRDDELQEAEQLIRQYGLPVSLLPAQLAGVVREVRGQQTVGTATLDLGTPELALHDEKKIVRKNLTARVNFLARITDSPQSYIYADLKARFGGPVATADLEGLRRRLEHVELLIRAQ